jgi:hypothetical protein
MLKFNIKVNNNISPLLVKQQKEIKELPKKAYDVFKDNTARRSGNARNKTKLRNNKQIVADYPYAQRLDEGWSQQYPEGMTKPTEEFIDKEFKRIMTGK